MASVGCPGFGIYIEYFAFGRTGCVRSTVGNFAVRRASFPFIYYVISSTSASRRRGIVGDCVRERFGLSSSSISCGGRASCTGVVCTRRGSGGGYFFTILFLGRGLCSGGRNCGGFRCVSR